MTVTQLVRAREWGELRGLLDKNIIDAFRSPTPPLTQQMVSIIGLCFANVVYFVDNLVDF